MAIFIAISSVLTGILGLFTVQLQRALKHMAVPRLSEVTTDGPTVSVCIPARNETHAMTQCLERVLASDYEKLEIIVFDDNSADDTSVLVKSFAHAGVRFVPGKKLPDGWLGKNHALDVLANEASGAYILFLDVDTYIHPATITRLVAVMESESLEMLSVIPGRRDTWRASVLLAPLRYFWQLVLAHKHHPAVSSALWMIAGDTLTGRLGGFAPHRSEVAPEAHIAAALGESYRCLLARDELGVDYEKKWRSQIETSQRLLYPLVGRSWWQMALALIVLALLNLPLIGVISTLIVGWSEVQIMAMWLLAAFMALYAMYCSRTWQKNWWLGGLLWPIVAAQEFILLLYSAWGYARHAIMWKGRSVTAPSRADSIEISE
jgi:glycosyltransferase involved in cell wall biosynthesis